MPSTKPPPKRTITPPPSQFVPGLHRHYKGGLYHAVSIARLHDTEPVEHVVWYVSCSTGLMLARSWCHPRKDSWTDFVLLDGNWQPRFAYIPPEDADALAREAVKPP